MSAAVLAMGLFMAARVMAGSLDPTNTPGPTMYTLAEIYQKVDTIATPQTLSDITTVVNAGYYAATNLTQVDTDLTAGNIATNVTIFGIAGTLRTNVYPMGVPKTGQTTMYMAGDDGDYMEGMAWPNPRFTVGIGTNSNCVTDHLTGSMWLRNPNATAMDWSDALLHCYMLDGSNGRGGYEDWRLPNWNELHSLMDASQISPALPLGHPFTGVQWTYKGGPYWSSTTCKTDTTLAWFLRMMDGYLDGISKTKHILRVASPRRTMRMPWYVEGQTR